LKQAQYAPVPVEEQVAMILASTKGYIDKVPVVRVKEFEKEFIELMKAQNKQVLDNFRAGKFEDADVAIVKKFATELASKY
jgi:F-type H+/Na+-transporting ATPase subunit alpha